MLAPNQVSAPATTQTSSIPPNDGTARLTSEGWTKIDEPTIVPTTIAGAWVSEIVRASVEVMWKRSPERLALLRESAAASGRSASGARGFQPSDPRIVSPARRGQASGLLVDRLDGREGVGFGRGLVAAIAFHAREAERDAARILRARLDVVERDLGDDL